jgi:hypothetical protein
LWYERYLISHTGESPCIYWSYPHYITVHQGISAQYILNFWYRQGSSLSREESRFLQSSLWSGCCPYCGQQAYCCTGDDWPKWSIYQAERFSHVM